MRRLIRLLILLFLFGAACSKIVETPLPEDLPPETADAILTTATYVASGHPLPTVAPTKPPYDTDWNGVEAAYAQDMAGNASSAARTLPFDSGYAAPAQFSSLSGYDRLSDEMGSLQAAIPDLQLTWRFRAHEGPWAAWAYALAGTFTQPLMLGQGASLEPTGAPVLLVVQALVHVNATGKIDNLLSAADTAAATQEVGSPLFSNEQVGDVALEQPLPEASGGNAGANYLTGYVNLIAASIQPSPFNLTVGPRVNSFGVLQLLYHGPDGDVRSGIPDIENVLVTLPNTTVQIDQTVHEGVAFGAHYTFSALLNSPLALPDGSTLSPNGDHLQFSGVALWRIQETGAVELWNDFDRATVALELPLWGAPATRTGSNVTAVPTEPAAAPTSTFAFTCAISAPKTVNLRSGPGTTFAKTGTLIAGASQSVIGQATGADGKVWYQLDGGGFVRSDLIAASGDCASAPTVSP